MKKLLVCMLLAVLPAWAAPPCTDCGVVRSVRAISKEQREVSPVQETKPSGLVISIPAGGGKAQVGSSTVVGKDVVPTIHTWEVVVKLDDGRFRIVTLDEPTDLRENDKVRFDKNGKLVRRDE